MRPRAIAVSADGSTIYVADAMEQSPEKIWIFTTAEYLRSRRNTRYQNAARPKGHQITANPNKNSEILSNYYSIANTQAPTKGNTQLIEENRMYRSRVYLRRFLSNQGTKGMR